MAEVFDCRDSSQLLSAVRAARKAIGLGELIVLPTDTVYGIAADAFSPSAVDRLLQAKGRGRQSPPPILISGIAVLDALAVDVVAPVRKLAETFWPGPLTIVVAANPSLEWDLGDTGGTVALRVPNDDFTLEVLRETGPLAVSSANKTSLAPAVTVKEAQEMLQDSVSVYLDGGPASEDRVASTIIDATRLTNEGGTIRILREGKITATQLKQVLPEITFEL